jgi:hypothetical protein
MMQTKRGRPTKPPTAGRKSPLGLRVTPGIKDMLDSAAQHNSRTQSQEAELRIEATFRSEQQLSQGLELVYGRQIAGLLTLIGHVLRDLGPMAHGVATLSMEVNPDWLSNPFALDQAEKAIGLIFDAIRPEGDPLPAHLRGPLVINGTDLNAMHRVLGKGITASYLAAVFDPASALSHDLQRIGAEVRDRLGAEVVGRLGEEDPKDSTP